MRKAIENVHTHANIFQDIACIEKILSHALILRVSSLCMIYCISMQWRDIPKFIMN